MTEGALTLRDATGAQRRGELVGRSPEGDLTVRLPDADLLVVPAGAIERRTESDVHLRLPFADLRSAADPAGPAESEAVPIVAEEAVVEKRSVPGDTVRVRTHTEEHEELIDEVLGREVTDVTHVAIDRIVDAPAPIREEGDTVIVPLHEEVLVVEKRLLLREEVHLTKRTEQRRETRRVRLQREKAHVERSAPAQGPAQSSKTDDAANETTDT